MKPDYLYNPQWFRFSRVSKSYYFGSISGPTKNKKWTNRIWLWIRKWILRSSL